MTVTKESIALAVAEKTACGPELARACVDDILDIVREGVNRDGSVLISSFGRFEKRRKSARMGKNMSSGEPAPIPERNVVVFKWSRQMRNRLNAKFPQK